MIRLIRLMLELLIWIGCAIYLYVHGPRELLVLYLGLTAYIEAATTVAASTGGKK
jgi:hypothetical protein